MGAGDDLIALYWTTSGPVEVHFGREWSLFDLRDRCEQAARVGFRGIGLWHADLEHVLESRTLREVRALLDEYGLDQLELEFLGDWFLDPSDERRKAADETTCAAVRSGRRAARPPHQGRQHHGHGVRAAADRRGLRRALRRRRPVHGREDRLRVHAVRRPGERRRHRARGGRGSGRAERRARVRHLAPRQAAARARRAAPHPVRGSSGGSSSATARTSTRRTGSTR